MNKSTLALAARISASLLDGYNEWVESCKQDNANGYRAHYCEHGTSRWTDYDNICGPCEDGMTMSDGVERRAYALDSAKRRVEKVQKIVEAATEMRRLIPGWEIPAEVWNEVTRLMTVE